MTDQHLCEHPDCGRPARTLALCIKHYTRLRRHGSTHIVKKIHGDDMQRFLAKVADRSDPNACWEWTGTKNELGYGLFRMDGRSIRAHRHMWILQGQRLDENDVLHHKCFNPSCVNPSHLEKATHQQNSFARSGAQANNKSSGFRNVHREDNKWVVRVKKDGLYRRFGRFQTIEEAVDVAQRARKELFGDFAGRG